MSKSLQDLQRICEILGKHHKERGAISAEHDIVYLAGDPEQLSPAEAKELEAMGVDYDKSFESYWFFT